MEGSSSSPGISPLSRPTSDEMNYTEGALSVFADEIRGRLTVHFSLPRPQHIGRKKQSSEPHISEALVAPLHHKYLQRFDTGRRKLPSG